MMALAKKQPTLLPTAEALGDADLVGRALSGDRWSRDMLYRRHAHYLLAVSTRLLSSRGEAEEVVQDTFVVGFEQLGTGERVPNRVRRLSAGDFLEVVEEIPRPTSVASGGLAASASLDTAGSATPVAPETPPGLGNREDSRDHVAMARTWRELARHGHNDEAYATLGAEGLRSESGRLGVDDLLALADVARLSGHPAEAVVPLQRVLSEFASNAQAPLLHLHWVGSSWIPWATRELRSRHSEKPSHLGSHKACARMCLPASWRLTTAVATLPEHSMQRKHTSTSILTAAMHEPSRVGAIRDEHSRVSSATTGGALF